MTTHARLIPCPSCAALNRIPPEKQAQGSAKCGKCHNELPLQKSVFEVSGQALQKIVLNSPQPVVVDFWAPWCGPCLSFAPTFEETAKGMQDKAIFLKLNTEAEQMAASHFNIRSIPTLILFENEKEKVRQSGALMGPQFKMWLNSVGVR